MGVGKSLVPPDDPRTGAPGMNLRLFGLGVSWVWINIEREIKWDTHGILVLFKSKNELLDGTPVLFMAV